MLQNLIQIFLENPIAQAVGIFALFINVIAVIYFKNKKFIFGIILTSVFWGLHFLLMGLYSGAIINFIDIIKNYASIKFKKDKNLMYFFLLLYLIIGVFLYTDIYSLLPVFASFIGIFSFFMLKGKKLKIGYLFVVMLWFLYGFLGKSIGGAIADGVLFISSIIGLIKINYEKTRTKNKKSGKGSGKNGKKK